MIDAAMKEQLKGHFASIEGTMTFLVTESDHPKQNELVSMLEGVAECHSGFSVEYSKEPAAADLNFGFALLYNGERTGVSYAGIPGGHEFTSFILGILNAAGVGKLPDPEVQAIVKSISEPVEIRTVVSLTCENCPDVVQAIQQIALLNPNVTHTMVEGSAYPEIAEKVKAVPQVSANGEVIHTGRGTFSDLLEKLTGKFQTGEVEREQDDTIYDVLVIGGGPAGASAAIYSARKGQKTAIVADKFGGQVTETVAIENVISQIYTEGKKLAADLEAHVREYDIALKLNRRVANIVDDRIPKVELNTGEVLYARSIIVATGAQWRKLGIPGESEYIGRGVAFCPHCDGPLYKGKDVAVIGGGNSGVEAAIDLAGICSNVTLFEYMDELKADKVLIDKLHSLPNTKVITGAATSEIVGNGDEVTGIRWKNRSDESEEQIDLAGVFVQIGLAPNSAVVKDIVETNRIGEIVIDEKGQTSVPYIFAAGDVTTVPYKQIIISMGEGAKASLGAFEYLITEAPEV